MVAGMVAGMVVVMAVAMVAGLEDSATAGMVVVLAVGLVVGLAVAGYNGERHCRAVPPFFRSPQGTALKLHLPAL